MDGVPHNFQKIIFKRIEILLFFSHLVINTYNLISKAYLLVFCIFTGTNEIVTTEVLFLETPKMAEERKER